MVPRQVVCTIESCGECGCYNRFTRECEAPELALPRRVKDAENIPWWCPLPMAKEEVDEDGAS